jgi:hypothetical protein
MKDSGQLTFTTMGGDTVIFPVRGKHYVQARGYAHFPGGGPAGETCGSCRHHVVRQYSKAYHKCELARACWTGGRASDILVRAAACSKWEKAE